MDEKKAIYKIITDLWTIFKDYALTDMTDDSWEKLIAAANDKSKEFRKIGKQYEMLFRGLYRAFENYIEEREKAKDGKSN